MWIKRRLFSLLQDRLNNLFTFSVLSTRIRTAILLPLLSHTMHQGERQWWTCAGYIHPSIFYHHFFLHSSKKRLVAPIDWMYTWMKMSKCKNLFYRLSPRGPQNKRNGWLMWRSSSFFFCMKAKTIHPLSLLPPQLRLVGFCWSISLLS